MQSKSGDTVNTTAYVNIITTSRPYKNVRMLFNEQPCMELEKEEARINADISSFIFHEVKKLCYSSGLGNDVHQKLLTGSGAIFL